MNLTIPEVLTLIPKDQIVKAPESFDSLKIVSIPSIDTRTIEKDGIFFAFEGETSDGHMYIKTAFEKGAALCIGSKEYDSETYVQVNNTLETLQSMAIVYREKYISSTTIIGVTGSVGKTTVKDMLSSALSTLSPYSTYGNFNNHIGVPLMILSIPTDTKVAVLEAGMNHRGEMKPLAKIMQPDIVVITNIGVAHIEFLKTREEIALEKLDLAAYSPRAHTVLIPETDQYADFIRENIKNGENKDLNLIKTTTDPLIKIDITVPGKHMLANAYLAYSAAKLLDISDDDITAGLKKAIITARRLEVHGFSTTVLIDDTYNANPDSMKAGLDVCNDYKADFEIKKRIAILGGMAELGEDAKSMHQDIVEYIKTLPNITEVYFVGELASLYGAEPYFKTTDEFVTFFKEKFEDHDNTLFFVKGSKSTKMSSLAELLLKDIK